jgi:GNAT superfamily N-acetyltransferase
VLEPSRHDRSRFDCGEPALDQWLRRYAGQNRRRDTAATWVIADENDRIAAYASIAMTGIDRSAAPVPVAKQAPDPVPALLLGRVAVDLDYNGRGVGTALVAHVLATALELNTHAAARAVVVNAINPKARRWWEHLGFHPFDPDDEDRPDLYLLTTEIAETLAREP